ncbi:MAG TPA: formate dehydrogenase accessory sulfurtransferase FdhD [Candidatus Acidoferrales bacterium]|nr:formate dehydrogenase accessory sulfurtransferase FdhD [Candidatus Acidoferrales bacterium]
MPTPKKSEKDSTLRNLRDVDVTLVHEWNDGAVRAHEDYLVGEEPLEIRVNGHPLSVTMRTPGNDFELVAGFLFTEGLIQRAEQIVSIEHAKECKATERGNIVDVKLAPDVELNLEATRRNFFAASSCGICGKASIDAVRASGVHPANANFRVSPETICAMPEKLRARQQNFARTGGLHAAGLFTATGELLAEREDIGRHNAVDKIVGWALLERQSAQAGEHVPRQPAQDSVSHGAVGRVAAQARLESQTVQAPDHASQPVSPEPGSQSANKSLAPDNSALANNLPLSECVLLVSGRGGFEIVQKAAIAGAPVVASVSACSSLAVQFAREMRLTLLGFLRNRRFIVYSAPDRLAIATEASQ